MSGARRSRRLKTAPPVVQPKVPNPTLEREEDSPDVCSSDQAPSHRGQTSSKKRSAPTGTRDTPPTKKKRGGKLRNLPDMPLDILFEIFSHLLPYDLLRLSRATKPFRQMLMKRSSAFVWKEARANIPSLPECPPGLSEPAYANLAFDPHCHFCGAQGAKKMSWFHFKRACKACDGLGYSNCYGQISLEALCGSLGIAHDRILKNTDADWLPGVIYGIFVWEGLKPMLLEYGAIEDEEQRAEWKKLKTAEKLERAKFSAAASHWLSSFKLQRHTEIKDVKERRRVAILDRLRNDGWADVIDKLDWRQTAEFEKHALVKQSKDLTERIWMNIRPQMMDLFGLYRSQQREQDIVDTQMRRLHAFLKALDDYFTTLPFNAIMPPTKEILLMSSVQAIIFDERWDLDFDESAFQEPLFAVPNLAVSWKAELDLHLSELLAPSADETTSMDTLPDISTLDLATSLFRCDECDECHLTYAQVLVHQCSDWRLYRSRASSFPSNLATLYPKGKLVPDKTTFAVCPHRGQMKKLLKACTLPENTTMAALQGVNPLVECRVVLCRRSLTARGHVMYWHELLFHGISQAQDMRVLSPKDLVGRRFQPMAGNRYLDSLHSVHSVYGCKHCYSPRPLDFEALKSHLLTRHEVEISSRESMEHYVIHPAARDPYKVLYERIPLLIV